MVWDEGEFEYDDEPFRETPFEFDFPSLLSKPKYSMELGIRRKLFPLPPGFDDYYKILEVDYDAPEETIRSNYIRLALKWHPDKQKGEDNATSRFQEINEAYEVLSNPDKRREYDRKGLLYAPDYSAIEYLNRFKGLILTCNGLGIRYSIF